MVCENAIDLLYHLSRRAILKTRLRRINGHQTGLANAIAIGLFSLILIPIFVLVGIFGKEKERAFWIIGLFLPIIYFVFTYLFSRLFIWLLNNSIKWIHGIEIELEEGKIDIGNIPND